MHERGFTVAGKAPPEASELESARARGFGVVELYLERTHLQDIAATVETVRASEVAVSSVHTPHVPIDEPQWLRRADRLADALDAYLVVHSNRIINAATAELDRLDFRSEYGYENNPGASERHVLNVILHRGHEFVLDTAHLYMAERNYLEAAERLLTEYGDQIRVVHLCDSTLTDDGLAFGEGTVDLPALTRLLKRKFEGLLVLEVMPEAQAAARQRLNSYGSESV